MPATYLFIGPSLNPVPSMDRVVVLPPIAAGDLLALPLAPGDTVGIVDGYFHRTQSVPHKEILHVLGNGVRVLGASSMGALRAAELRPFGMEGVGQIFADYRDGRITADDEVALWHGPAEDGYPQLSVPLVNIRATVAAAVNAGRCDAELATRVLAHLAQLPYRDRGYARIATHALQVGADLAAAARLAEFCATTPVDVKRNDAIGLIAMLGTPRRAQSTPDTNRTLHLWEWQLATNHAQDLRALRACQVLAHDYPDVLRMSVLGWIADRCRKECATPAGEPDDVVAVSHGAHAGRYALGGDMSFLDAWTTSAERDTLPETELLARFLVRSFRVRPGIAAIDLAMARLRADPAHRRALLLTERIAEVNKQGREHRPDFDPSAIAPGQITEWLSRHWQVPAEHLDIAAYDRGFVSTTELVAAARFPYLAGHCDTETMAFTMRA